MLGTIGTLPEHGLCIPQGNGAYLFGTIFSITSHGVMALLHALHLQVGLCEVAKSPLVPIASQLHN